MSEFAPTKIVTLAITGASGAPYAMRLLECLLSAPCKVYLLISDAAAVVLAQEMDIHLPECLEEKQQWFLQNFRVGIDQLQVFDKRDWFSPVASGSAYIDAMIICPASGGTISAIASGASNNLIERAADVVLKEKRQLILVPREAPLSEIHLENLLKLSRVGAHIIPACPGFYQKPQTVEDLVDFIVARILMALGLPQSLLPEWGNKTLG